MYPQQPEVAIGRGVIVSSREKGGRDGDALTQSRNTKNIETVSTNAVSNKNRTRYEAWNKISGAKCLAVCSAVRHRP
jgi:hypothetical protein